ncbi:enoyl-CoA hydratase-related protein [Aldersonia sp. NBC_00410]|uniref:enoyl-CoA hydratase/isomerase family protein n=1 Tax=Aldersonia sp. NBC_00410 TaxID=2975954 RepID=UPI0022503048|nr:enoyl-CoA hydratase-related protein [Aldersonia sp. NBC_00410]MCX5044907.1 enoyl-CoA hydratase-related protein [Aldersonia sp. NBC_00410]
MTTNLLISDAKHVRTLTLNRPEALNAFDEALYDATADALAAAAADPDVSVVVLTGTGRAFSAGTDLNDLQARVTDPDFTEGTRGFIGLVDELAAFPKPLICAINGLGLGIGTTVIGFADLVFMASTARLKCPFTSLGVAPEAASSYLLPALIGRQNAAWLLLSSEWITAADALQMGLVWRVCEPDDLVAEATRHAEVLAARPLSSLIAVKSTMTAPHRAEVAAARERENAYFAELLGTTANSDALASFTGGASAGSAEAGSTA